MKTNETTTESASGTHAYNDATGRRTAKLCCIADSVISVLNMLPFNDKHNLNMFDLRYQLRLNDLYDLTSTNILYYEQVQQHINLLVLRFSGQTVIRFNQHMNRLYLDMDLSSINAGEYIII